SPGPLRKEVPQAARWERPSQITCERRSVDPEFLSVLGSARDTIDGGLIDHRHFLAEREEFAELWLLCDQLEEIVAAELQLDFRQPRFFLVFRVDPLVALEAESLLPNRANADKIIVRCYDFV